MPDDADVCVALKKLEQRLSTITTFCVPSFGFVGPFGRVSWQRLFEYQSRTVTAFDWSVTAF